MAAPAASNSPFEKLSLEHSSTVDRVAEELRRALFEGEVTPGTPLRENALADAMGVSRSTIREALGALVAEGLATRAPNRGVHVTELDPDSVRDVCRSRASSLASCQRRTPATSRIARERQTSRTESGSSSVTCTPRLGARVARPSATRAPRASRIVDRETPIASARAFSR